MDELNNYSFNEYKFTIWFFRLLLFITLLIAVLVFVLNINETVTVSNGEIVAANPQADYKAPFEAQVLKIYVKEGMPVRGGDTLLIIQNLDLMEQQSTKKTEIDFLEKKNQINCCSARGFTKEKSND